MSFERLLSAIGSFIRLSWATASGRFSSRFLFSFSASFFLALASCSVDEMVMGTL